MSKFVHLHVHSQYSILDGQASIQRLVDKAMADGQPGIAVTDHGDMFGIKEFYNYVKKQNGKKHDKIKTLKKLSAGLEKLLAEGSDPAARLRLLKEELAALEGRFRIRFSSIELQTVTDGVIDAMASRPDRFCNYLHLPLQSGCDGVLKAMNRHYNTEQYAAKVAALRARVAGVSVFADVIAGFPTETEDDFEASYRFIESQKLCGLHVFSYSPRPLTKAAALPQLSSDAIKRRAERLRELDKKLRADFASSLAGTEQEVFVEEHGKHGVSGVTSNFQHVMIENASADLHGLVRVRITRAEGPICYALVCRS